ncbi:hypothetical protein EBF04_21410 [Streptomyces sp. I6]|nr:hypothetical protein EBF04_21410 [Streptomyces sp. I6]
MGGPGQRHIEARVPARRPPSVPAWSEVLNTDAARYGGGDVRNDDPVKPESVTAHGHRTSVQLTLPPLATVWLKPA